MKKALVLFVLVLWSFLPSSVTGPRAATGPKETLFAKVNLHVTWEKRNENSGEIRKGNLNLAMSGTLKLNRGFSGKAGQGRFTPLLAYALENPSFNYTFNDQVDIQRDDNPPKCPNPQLVMNKGGSASGDQGGMPVNLYIHYHAGLADEAARLPVAIPGEAQAALIDYYEFTVLVPDQKAEGKGKAYDAERRQCKEIDQSDPILGGQIDIAWKIGEGGKLSGGKSWSSPALSYTFGVKVSNLPESFKKKEAVPVPGKTKKNDVKYSLTWDFDAAPVAQIEREIEGHWFDVTGLEQTVTGGETIKLRGMVAPRSMDSARGRWSLAQLSGDVIGTGEPVIKEDVVSPQPLVLTKKELQFIYIGTGTSEVTYTTSAGGQELSAKVKFIVKEWSSKPPKKNPHDLTIVIRRTGGTKDLFWGATVFL